MACYQKTGCCCGCCSIRTGTKVIGILSLIGCSLAILSYIRLLLSIPENLENSGVFAPSIIGIVLFAILFISATFLLVAVSKHKPKFLLPWLITCGISSIYNFGIFMVFGVLAIIEGINTNEEEIQTAAFITAGFLIVFGIFVGALYLYFWLVVYSYYRVLKSDPN